MEQLQDLLKKLFLNEEGASVVEYGVLIALIIAAVIAIIMVLGIKVEKGLNDFIVAFNRAMSGSRCPPFASQRRNFNFSSPCIFF